MFTVCPKCALTLVVTAEDLRVAQGYVRCGRCSSVFNALARLTEERLPDVPAAAPRETPAAAQTRTAPEEAERPALAPSALIPSALDDEIIPEDALEFDPTKTDVTSVFVEPSPNPEWTAATGTFKAMLAANQEASQPAAPPETSAPEEPTPPADRGIEPDSGGAGEGEDGDIDVELDPELLASILQADVAPPAAPAPANPASAQPPAAPLSAAAAVPAPRPTPTKAEPPKVAQREPTAPPAPPTPPAIARRRPPPPPPPPPPAPPRTERAPHFERPARFQRIRDAESAAHEREGPRAPPSVWRARLLPYAWSSGAALALLMLLAQIVNHYRDDLAASARFNRPLTALYAALGVQLSPRWDLRAYDVRQLGASVEPGASGLITVRASIKNAAPQAQPLPLLRVTLQDRFGNRIAARDVTPPSYLPHPAPPAKFLSAGQRIDAEMGFVDPGANAVGFEIDACLPTSGGEVTCANDAAAR